MQKARDDLIAGTCAGVAITLTGHPFDTVKVRLQTQPGPAGFSSGLQCAWQTVRREGGPRALYKGMGGPLTTVPLVNAIVFMAYESAKRFCANFSRNDDLSSLQIAACGGWAGFANSFIVGPVELIKTRLQLQRDNTRLKANRIGPSRCLAQIMRQHGVRGVFHGLFATIVREVPAYMGQFGTYEVMKRALSGNSSGEGLSAPALLLCGGAAGIGCWVFSYPQDVIKSKLQAAGSSQH